MDTKVKRNNIRFSPDENTLITIELEEEKTIVGLAFSEAHGGYAGIFTNNSLVSKLTVDQRISVKLGSLENRNSQIKWIKQIDDDVIKIGFEILD